MSEQLYERCKQRYQDEELARAVYEEAESKGHTDKIMSGELVMPDPVDARKWLEKKQGRDNESPSEREAHKKIRELEERINQMTPH